jgi:RND family efflux transporter MFP subunit
MKNFFIISIITTSILITSCGGKGGTLDLKKAELASLKSKAKEINDKIATLEKEIAKLEPAKKALAPTEIVTTEIEAVNFKTYIDVQGHVDAEENVSISTQMPGMITRINVKPGDEVRKGQILAETDINALQQQISDLETNLSLAKQAYQKQENLWKQNIGTEMQYLQAKTSKESLEKKMSAMQEQVRMSKIISPINGTVDAVNIKLAQMVSPGMPAISVVNFSNLTVKADLAESYASRVKTGNNVTIFFPDINDSMTAKIHYASRAIDPLKRTFYVEIKLPNNSKFHPNMVAKLKINDYSSSKPVITVPIKFIQKTENQSFVLVEENGVAVKKEITIAKEYNGMAEISNGLNAGDKLIIEGYDMINPGDKVILKK